MEIGELVSKYWNIYWILIGPVLSPFRAGVYKGKKSRAYVSVRVDLAGLTLTLTHRPAKPNGGQLYGLVLFLLGNDHPTHAANPIYFFAGHCPAPHRGQPRTPPGAGRRPGPSPWPGP